MAGGGDCNVVTMTLVAAKAVKQCRGGLLGPPCKSGGALATVPILDVARIIALILSVTRAGVIADDRILLSDHDSMNENLPI